MLRFPFGRPGCRLVCVVQGQSSISMSLQVNGAARLQQRARLLTRVGAWKLGDVVEAMVLTSSLLKLHLRPRDEKACSYKT